MSFICDITKKHCDSKPTVVVDQKRSKIYPNGTRGWEIVKELKLSPEGLSIWQRRQLENRGS